ncbi:MAG: hypothetical protein HZA15_16005 [Nitrospirae bacterium]|nr:hypothetical protein [Nitrospirota bacterium]
MPKPKLALILGSGFSKDAGLPTTADIPEKFLMTPTNTVLTSEIEDEISKILRKFWERVFGFKNGGPRPSLEDHFTLLDLAANSGHHLGPYYSPKKLRAIRRMSIHRVFSLVTFGKKKRPHIRKMLYSLNKNFDLSIVTLNWDIIVERHLENYADSKKLPFYYPIEAIALTGTFANQPWPHDGVPLMKMHGSTNWVYCDSCRRIYAGRIASTALNRKTFLEPDDFRLFDVEARLANQLEELTDDRDCPHCGNVLAGRVATFSYRKAFSIAQFHTIWERAHFALCAADNWLLIGYSMPEADYEFKHLLKSAQLGRNKKNWIARVVLKDDLSAENRYKSFLGLTGKDVYQGGLSKWIHSSLDEYIGER